MKLFVELNTQSHITIILVTHESDIAAYGRRLVGFLDGKIISDQVLEKT
jgi:putative ABC transport system ATP-binding protein